MASSLFRKFARSQQVALLENAYRSRSYSNSGGGFRIPVGAIAAVSGGFSCLFYLSSSNLAYLDERNDQEGPKVALNPDKWLEFELQDTASVSHNTNLFRFTFDPSAKLGLDVASCLVTRAGEEADGKKIYVSRPYTPISDPDVKGYFDLLIKLYPEGKMSQHFAKLKPGDVLEVKGPIEKVRYTPNMKKHIGMVNEGSMDLYPHTLMSEKLRIKQKRWRIVIAGGSGITLMLQIIDAILRNPEDNTQVSLIYGNVSPDDILLKQRLDMLEASHPNLYSTLDKPSKNWKGGSGYISKDIVLKGLPGPSDDTLILVCGPPGLMDHISGNKAKDWTQGELTGILKDLGYTEQMVYKL